MIDCDVKAKRAQEQIFKLLRNKLYGVEGEGQREPEPVVSAGDDLRGARSQGHEGRNSCDNPHQQQQIEENLLVYQSGGAMMLSSTSSNPTPTPLYAYSASSSALKANGQQTNSVTNPSNKGKEGRGGGGSGGGVGCCWLCETTKPPFVDHRLQLLYSASGDYPALPLVENPASAAARNRMDGVVHVGKVITSSNHVETDPLSEPQHMRSFSSSGAAEVKCVKSASGGYLPTEIDPSKSSSSSSSAKKRNEVASKTAQKGTESAEKGFMSSLVSYFYASSGSMSTTAATTSNHPPKTPPPAAATVAGQTKGQTRPPSGRGLAVGTVVTRTGTPCVTSDRARAAGSTPMATNTTTASAGTKPPDFVEISYIAPTKAARLNRKMRKALAEWDVIDDLIPRASHGGGTTSNKPSTSAGSSSFSPHLGPNAQSPPLDVTRMLLCLSCFKLCYDGFSRPELVTDREAMEKRTSLSNRIHKLADVLRFGGSGGDEPHHKSEEETTAGGADGAAKHKSNNHAPLSLSSSKRKSKSRRIATEKPPNIDGNVCAANVDGGGDEESVSDSGSDTDYKDFVDLGGSGYDIFINTHGNFLLAEAILGESHASVEVAESTNKNASIQLKSLDDSVESRSSALKSVSSPVVFGARGVSAFSTPPRQDSISIANTTADSNSVSGRHPVGLPPDVERESAQTHRVDSVGRATTAPDAAKDRNNKTIPCSYCGEELYDQRGHSSSSDSSHNTNRGVSYCIAFHPNPYFHRIWNCPSCTSLMTVALPQCLVCRTDAAYYNESAMVAALNSDINTNSRTDPAGGARAGGPTATQALDELLLNIGATRQTQIGDGNCLFRSLAHQLFGNQDCHMLVREMCCDYIETHREDYEMLVVGMGLGATQPRPSSFSNRVAQSAAKSDATHDHEGNEIALLSAREDLIFPQYVARMRMSGTWGDELCVHAAARLFTVRIHVLTSDFPNSRWHLVFEPNPEDREERRGSRREASLANTVNSKNNRKTCADNNTNKKEENTSEISRWVRHEYDDCSPKTEKKDENEQQPISLSKSSRGANTHLPSTRIADIFLLYLRPFHYDDIVSPPVLRSVMEKLSETLQLELAEEEGWL